MKVVKKDSIGLVCFIPTDEKELKNLLRVIGMIKPGEILQYVINHRLVFPVPEHRPIYFYAGGKKSQKETSPGILETVYEDGADLLVKGDTEQDYQSIDTIRDTCNLATFGLIYLGQGKVAEKTVLFLTGSYCKHCGKAITDWVRCAWHTCQECVAKCEHAYVARQVRSERIIDGNSFREYCSKCGHAKNDPEIQLKQPLGCKVIYQNQPLSPAQIASLEAEVSEKTCEV